MNISVYSIKSLLDSFIGEVFAHFGYFTRNYRAIWIGTAFLIPIVLVVYLGWIEHL